MGEKANSYLEQVADEGAQAAGAPAAADAEAGGQEDHQTLAVSVRDHCRPPTSQVYTQRASKRTHKTNNPNTTQQVITAT